MKGWASCLLAVCCLVVGCSDSQECQPETDTAFCQRLGKDCGTVSGTDNCGSSRSADCGSCTPPETCGIEVANVCGYQYTGPRICGQDGWCWYNPLPTGNSWWGIWGAATDDIWVVGDYYSLLHWDGTEWSYLEVGSVFLITTIWGLASDDIWIDGDIDCMYHWDGTSWSPRYFFDFRVSVYDVWGSATDDVWVAAFDSMIDQAVALHWDGAAWSELLLDTNKKLRKVWGSGPDDIWMVGDEGSAVNGVVYPNINQSKGEDGGTGTGRLSYTAPALQQIPSRRKDVAAIVKPCFLPDEGQVWVDCDMNSFEVRTFADLVGNQEIINEYILNQPI